MLLKRVGLVAALGVCFLASSAWAQVKIGYVDPQKFLASFKPFQEAQSEYTRYEEELNREFSKLQNEFEKMKDEFYQIRDWDVATGLQKRAKLEELNLGEIADKLEGEGLLA